MRIISGKDVEKSLLMPEAIEVMRRAFAELSGGTAIVPPRIHLEVEKRGATTLVMPAFLSGANALACKIVSVFPGNARQNLPLIHAVVVLIDAETGAPLAVIEGASLTALRTGAASGLATDLLARKNARTLAVFGAGRQSRTQIEAVCAARRIEEIIIYDRKIESAQKLVAETEAKIAARFKIAETPGQAVARADIVCAATTSAEPVFNGDDLPAGAHVNAVGSFTAQMREIDFTTLRRAAKIVIDSRAALAEAGELAQAIEQKIIAPADIYAELGELAVAAKRGRSDDKETTIFKSVGNAVQDAAIAARIYEIALAEKRGLEVDL